MVVIGETYGILDRMIDPNHMTTYRIDRIGW